MGLVCGTQDVLLNIPNVVEEVPAAISTESTDDLFVKRANTFGPDDIDIMEHYQRLSVPRAQTWGYANEEFGY